MVAWVKRPKGHPKSPHQGNSTFYGFLAGVWGDVPLGPEQLEARQYAMFFDLGACNYYKGTCIRVTCTHHTILPSRHAIDTSSSLTSTCTARTARVCNVVQQQQGKGAVAGTPGYNHGFAAHTSNCGGATPGYPYAMTAACDSRQLSEDDWHCVANVYDGTAINAYVGVLYGVTLYAIAPHAGRSTRAAPRSGRKQLFNTDIDGLGFKHSKGMSTTASSTTQLAATMLDRCSRVRSTLTRTLVGSTLLKRSTGLVQVSDVVTLHPLRFWLTRGH